MLLALSVTCASELKKLVHCCVKYSVTYNDISRDCKAQSCKSMSSLPNIIEQGRLKYAVAF